MNQCWWRCCLWTTRFVLEGCSLLCVPNPPGFLPSELICGEEKALSTVNWAFSLGRIDEAVPLTEQVSARSHYMDIGRVRAEDQSCCFRMDLVTAFFSLVFEPYFVCFLLLQPLYSFFRQLKNLFPSELPQSGLDVFEGLLFFFLFPLCLNKSSAVLQTPLQTLAFLHLKLFPLSEKPSYLSTGRE